MKVLDYSGLQKLAANIKKYIAAQLQPISDLAPFHAKMYSVSSDASTVSPSGVISLSSSSTGVAGEFYQRLQSGLPSAIQIDINSASDPSVSNPIWLYLDNINNTTYTYASGEVSDGTTTTKRSLRLTINMGPSIIRVTLRSTALT